MKAMIFAAGLGTRLRPLTADKPKALVSVGGMPLLEIAIRRLQKHGVREIVVNVHHFADQVIHFLQQRGFFGLTIHISDERDKLLDTGGGLKKAAHLLSGDPFFIMNTDVLTNMNFSKLMEAHRKTGAKATLAARRRSSSRQLLFGDDWQLVGWQHNRTGERRMSRDIPEENIHPYAFSGIQVVDPAIFAHFPNQEVFSTIDWYLEAARTESIRAYLHDGDIWLDVGKIQALKEAEGVLPFIDL